jgi:hypothetical protein
MLTLEMERNGRQLAVELPLPIDLLVDELRGVGIDEPPEQIYRADFLLQPTNDLGEHLMKLLSSDDVLHRIAIAAREPSILADVPRQALEALILKDSFRDLDHMSDYLQHGSAALDHFIRLRVDGQTIDLPDRYLHGKLDKPPHETRLIDLDYLPLNEQGKLLLTALSPYDTIATANIACALQQMPELRAEPEKLVEGARRLLPPQPAIEQNFYCPLTLRMDDDDGNDLVEMSPDILRWYEDEIRAVLADEVPEGENMAEYLSGALKDKIASVTWDVARFDAALYGKISCQMRAPLSPDEQTALVDWITGQNSDGLGEGVEQRPVSSDDGDLYVSLWHGGDGYYVLPESEFLEWLHHDEPLEDQGSEPTMGGM